MRLSENFWLYEFTRSQKATRLGIDNTPPADVVANIQALVSVVLQPLRSMICIPINISSGYRSSELNAAIGGSQNSQHIVGKAADIEAFGLGNVALAEVIRQNFHFDQLILEFHVPEDGLNSGWVHVSYQPDQPNRRQTFRAARDSQGVSNLSYDDFVAVDDAYRAAAFTNAKKVGPPEVVERTKRTTKLGRLVFEA